MMRKRLAAILIAATTLLTIGGFAASATASVSTTTTREGALSITASAPVTTLAAPAGCSSGNVCFWKNAGYSDGPGELSNRNPDWSVFSHSSCAGGTWNDCASSVYNAGVSCSAMLWPAKNYHIQGTIGTIKLTRGTGMTNLADLPLAGNIFNDEISSNSWVTEAGGTSSACGGPN